jgi:hypothetical protein
MKQCRVLRWDFNYGKGKVVSVMKHYFMKSYDMAVVQLHASPLQLIKVLSGSHPAHFIHWIEASGAGLDALRKTKGY